MNLKELKKENEELESRVEDLEEELKEVKDLCYKFEQFMKPCAIGQEQMWDILESNKMVSPDFNNSGNLEDYI